MLLTVAARTMICHRCKLMTRPSGAVAVCGKDGVNIKCHAEKGYCPAYRYTKSGVPEGEAIPEGWNPKDFALDSRGTGGCGCK